MVRQTTAKFLLAFYAIGAAAQQPTIIARPIKNYQISDGPTPSGNDIIVEPDLANAGIRIFLGPDRASAFKTAVDKDCGTVDSTCLQNAQKALSIVPNEDGVQKRIIPLLIAGAFAVVGMVVEWIHLVKSDSNYVPVKVALPTPTDTDQAVWASATAVVYKPSADAEPTTVVISSPPAPAVTAAVENAPGSSDTVVTFPPGNMKLWASAAEQAICPRSVLTRDPITVCLRRRTEQAVMAALLNAGIGGMELIHLPRQFQVIGNPELASYIAGLIPWAMTIKTLYNEANLKRMVQIIALFIWETLKNIHIAEDVLTIIELELNRMTLKQGKVKVDEGEEKQSARCSKVFDAKTELPGFDKALQEIVAAIAADPNWNSPPDVVPKQDPNDKAHDKVCNKETKEVREDKSKWKWGQRDQMVAAIENTFCKLDFKNPKYTGNVVEEQYNHDQDTFKLRLGFKDAPPSPELCVEFLKELVDVCDGDPEASQYNLKWGGKTVQKSTGNVFEVIPTEPRVATTEPNWECNTWQNRGDKGNKGKDGKDLLAETEDQMMKLQCVHQLFNMGWVTKAQDCGGHYNIIMTGSNGYANSQDCWRYHFPCISDSIVNKGGVIMTGTHWAGSAGHTKNHLGIRCWMGFENY